MEFGPILRAMQRNKLRFGLIAAQIAVTLAIVANCMTLILDARRKLSRPPAFDDDNLIAVYLRPPVDIVRDDRRREDWLHDAIGRLRAIPGVRGVTQTVFRLWENNWSFPVKAAGSSSEPIAAACVPADESFPDALGAEMDEGRWFTRDEVEHSTQLSREVNGKKRDRTSDGKARDPIVVEAVVSRAFGQLVFGEGPLLGKMLEDDDGDKYRIVGVLRRYYAPSEQWHYDDYAMFYPNNRDGTSIARFGAPLIVRATPGNAATVARMIEEWLSHGFEVPVQGRAVLQSVYRDIHFGPQRMTAALMGLLVALLLLVASLGIAGLTSFSVTERTRQIGTRRALGATTADILRYFLTEAWLLTTTGLVLGAGLAVGLNMVLLTVYTDAKLGAGIVTASALLLWIVGLGAALPPALRGARTSPAIATRNV